MVGAAVVVGAGVSSTDVIVNASMPPTTFLNRPTAVQFPTDPHDTELKNVNGLVFYTPAANTAGVA